MSVRAPKSASAEARGLLALESITDLEPWSTRMPDGLAKKLGTVNTNARRKTNKKVKGKKLNKMIKKESSVVFNQIYINKLDR